MYPMRSRSCTTRHASTATPALPSPTPADRYAPGPIREAHDAEHAAVAAFISHHPEYASQSPDVIAQAMSTYRTEEEHTAQARLRDEGVPARWRKDLSGDADNDGDGGGGEPLGRF